MSNEAPTLDAKIVIKILLRGMKLMVKLFEMALRGETV
jgi:hypothetical protein